MMNMIMRFPSNNEENVINKRTVFLSYETTSKPVQIFNNPVKKVNTKRVYNKRTHLITYNDSIKNDELYIKPNMNVTTFNFINHHINHAHINDPYLNSPYINKKKYMNYSKRNWKNK